MHKQKGFTLIETIVGAAVFVVVAVAAYQAYVSLFAITSANQYKIIALNLINEQFEVVRNMPYNDVGIVNSIPKGKIPYQQTINRTGINYTITATVRNIDLPFDGVADGTPDDQSPADNRLVQFTVTCTTCTNFSPITLSTNVAPKNLETASTNGALSIKVFDANGVAIQGANVHIVNSKVTPNITVDDVTGPTGILQIVDAATGTNAYSISVTKSGYSTDRTYPPGAVGNPSPSKPDSTVLLQQVTPVSFAIDRLSSLSFSSVTDMCVAVPNVDFTMTGSKLIGIGKPKYSQALTTGSTGNLTLNSLEWDSYTIGVNDTDFDVIGLSPLNPVNVNPGASQSVMLIMVPKNPKTLLVTVKDGSTGLPLSDATVTLSSGATSSKITGLGYLSQSDWSGGSGQATTTNSTKYFVDDGNVETNSPSGDLKLKNIFGSYVASGILESSTFDVGAPTNFHNLFWNPTDQPVGAGTTSALFQIATNSTTTATTTWSFKGPDGTAGTFYMSPSATINVAHNNDRYLRYKAFLSTQSTSSTPTLSDFSFTYTSSCTPPGQVVFSGLSSGNYTLTVSHAGYADYSSPVTVSSSWAEQQVLMAP